MTIGLMATQGKAHAQNIAPDGAIGLNQAYDQGTSTVWYIELQDEAYYTMLDGIKREDDSEIQVALTILQWGFDHEAPDGSFPGTGDAYHSTSIFVAYAAQALQILKYYSPVTHTSDLATYQDDIQKWSPMLQASCYWMLRPDIAASAARSEFPYTHRRFICASCYGQVGNLANDDNLISMATAKGIEGIARALPAGWQAALYPFDTTTGNYPPATLLAPGQAVPSGSSSVISAQYVLPEENGFDVSYQCVSCMNVVNFYPFSVDSTVSNNLQSLLGTSLPWDEQWIDASGGINVDGSSRIGQSAERGGKTKAPSVTEMIRAYYVAGEILDSPSLTIYANRLARPSEKIFDVTIGTDGAANRNIAYDAGTSTTLYIGDQAASMEAIAGGDQYEDSALFTNMFLINDWTFAKQATNGSFTGASDGFAGTSKFVQAVADDLIKLKAYSPSTYAYSPNTYSAETTSETNDLQKALAYLLTYDAASAGFNSEKTSSSSLLISAAGFQEAGTVTGNVAASVSALKYLNAAIALQMSTGVDPEGGQPNAASQAQGVVAAAQYYNDTTDTNIRSSISSYISKALTWEMTQIDVHGLYTAGAKTAPMYVGQAFALGAQITGDPKFTVGANRIYANFGRTNLPIPDSAE